MELERVIAVRNNKTIYRSDNKCIKVFNADYSKADVLNEALNQTRVEETGLEIPKLLEVTTTNGKWAIVSEYIKGKTLALLMEENPDKKDEYLNLFVDLQLKIHSKSSPHLNKLKDKLNSKIRMCSLNATTRYALHSRIEDMPKHDNVCHGDFNPSNIIIAEDGTPFIIDWSHATQGNAYADVARTYLIFRFNNDVEGAKKYLDLFCEKTGADKKAVQGWIGIVAAAQSIMGNKKERDFMLSWVNFVDYE